MHDYGIFKVVQRDKWTIIEPGDWANVVALTPDGNIVLVRQYRAGSDCVSIELPSGKIDPGEGNEAAAIRELLEETGYAGTSSYIGRVTPNPAIMNNVMHYFLVEDAIKVADQNLDDGEECDVLVVPYADIKKMIWDGTFHHALSIAAITLYELS